MPGPTVLIFVVTRRRVGLLPATAVVEASHFENLQILVSSGTSLCLLSFGQLFRPDVNSLLRNMTENISNCKVFTRVTRLESVLITRAQSVQVVTLQSSTQITFAAIVIVVWQ